MWTMCHWIYEKCSTLKFFVFSLKKLKNWKDWCLSNSQMCNNTMAFTWCYNTKSYLVVLSTDWSSQQYTFKNRMQKWKVYNICFWDQMLFLLCYCWPTSWCIWTGFHAFLKSVPLFIQQYLENWLNLSTTLKNCKTNEGFYFK